MSLSAISPIDGRYRDQTRALAPYFSEFALIRHRVLVEVEWLLWMSLCPDIPAVRLLTRTEIVGLRKVATQFDEPAAERVKTIESTTRHDVKAVEYYLREAFAGIGLDELSEWIHFGCTSEDINNLAYALMLQGAISEVWLPCATKLVASVATLAGGHAAVSMLARTHGQSASPTTMGKELAVFVARWKRQLRQVEAQEYLGKFSGAVGNFNAHVVTFPQVPWRRVCGDFVRNLGLQYNELTTQIEPHDYMAELFQAVVRFNSITLDFVRDMWTYISLGYFRQQAVAGEVGSSTMPHKVNPIDFENAEANLGVSSALLEHLAGKLPVSRLQRDLSDSSALRNVGPALAHSLLALESTLRGLKKVSADAAAMAADLDGNWEVLGEAIQTVLRAHGQSGAYERLKELTRGKPVDRATLRVFINGLDLPAHDKQRLLTLEPASYIGLAVELSTPD